MVFTRLNKQVKVSRIVAGLVVAVAVAAASALPLLAEQTYGGGNVQAYAADKALENGVIVQLTGEKSDRVKLAIQSEAQNMFGVTVDRQQLSVKLSEGNLENETFVAVSGTYNVLVSTQGGAIMSGDYIAL